MPYHHYHHQKLLQKKTLEIYHNFLISPPEHHIFHFLFLRRDRKAYANNPSYHLPLSTKT